LTKGNHTMPKRSAPFAGTSLTVKMLLMTVAIGLVVWMILNKTQERDLRQTFMAELSNELNERAREDRHLFDRHINGVNNGARLIASQKRFMDYLSSPTWIEEHAATTVTNHYTLPPWMPKSSVMRSFFYARNALLFDHKGILQEVYHHSPHPVNEDEIPEELLHSSLILKKLSHNQAYMTAIEDKAYIIAARHVLNEGKLQAILMLVSPIDNDFLVDVRGHMETANVMALIDSESGLVLASSDSELIPSGGRISELKDRFIMMGKGGREMPFASFFDYGASDLELKFISMVPTEKAEKLTESVLFKNNRQRVVLASALILSFSILTLWISTRIRNMTQRVMLFSKNELGIEPLKGRSGDELNTLENQFNRLFWEVIEARAKLRHETEEKIELTRKVMENEHRKQREMELRESHEQLRSLTVHIQNVREDERKKISRDIHDDLGQALTVLHFDLSWIEEMLNEDQEALIDKTRKAMELVDSAIKRVQEISSGLRPPLLDDLGIVAAIEWQANEFQNRTGIICNVNSEPDKIELEGDLATEIFRIFQEALTNVARHADAISVNVGIKMVDDELVLEVADNGKGIPQKKIFDPGSIGLIGIRERVLQLGGKFTIAGTNRKGTTAAVAVPVGSKGDIR